ncbi:6-hydroxymethylpterin diphosphokinase MptE-like protein [Colwellia sp. D2M02]|uniref:motility associated factor glycosyltransferase family protein n=1 Tax=Colwellia sp. D2M02 TaxID=2841562 RepID=UPI00339D9AF8
MNSIKDNLDNIEKKLLQVQKKAEQEHEFSIEANARFEKNLKAFEQYFPEIQKKFINYQPSDNFQFIINDNGTANIIDYDTKVPMYSDDPITQVHQQVAQSLTEPVLSNLNFSGVEFLENTTGFLHVDLMKAIGAQYNKAKDSLPPNKLVDKNIPSAIIFGVGLGYHLMELAKATTASYLSIFEPNEDYFFASLFCFDWVEYLKVIDKSGAYLYIGIGDAESDIYQHLYQRAQDIGPFSISNSYFYQHYPSKAMQRLTSEIQNNFHQFFMGWGFFDDALMSMAHTIGVMDKSPHILKGRSALAKEIKDFPIFIIANGPSLDADIEKIKQEKDNVILVSCNSATTALLAQGITPDFHIALERTKATADFLSAHISKKDRDIINLLVVNVMYPGTLDLFKWSGVALKGNESGTTLYQMTQFINRKEITPTVGYCNPLVGNTGLSFFTNMGFENIYLFGVDSGYIDEEHHHSKSSYYYNKKGKSVYAPLKMGAEFRVEGNFGKPVITEPFLYTGKQQMERLIESFKHTNLTCFNCSDGVKIEGAYPLRSSDILLPEHSLNKIAVVDKIKSDAFEPSMENADLKSLLDFDLFEDICKTMVEILTEPMENRSQALDSLIKQLRYLKSFKQGGRHVHLYLLLEGEALYVNSVLISLLYNFGNNKEIIPYFKPALNYWIDFLRKAPDYYRERWDLLSTYSFDYSETALEEGND